jgi:hypothetical protein
MTLPDKHKSRKQKYVTTEILEKKNDGVYDSVYDSVYDGVYDSVYDGVHDNDHDGNYDKKILAFTVIPRSRKEIIDLLGISTHTKNYERHIAPLLEKGLLAMTFPDKPKSKKQKYLTTEKGHKILVKK